MARVPRSDYAAGSVSASDGLPIVVLVSRVDSRRIVTWRADSAIGVTTMTSTRDDVLNERYRTFLRLSREPTYKLGSFEKVLS